MSTNIFVGNLPFNAEAEDLRNLFGAYGTVETVNIITDRDTGRSRGFGFVEMSSGGQEAIDALHQTEMGGRALNVNVAKPRQDRSPRQERW